MTQTSQVNVRSYALDIIVDVMDKGVYSDKAVHNLLDSGVIADKRDRAFLTRLCEGTIERVIEIDYIINQFSKVKVNKMKPVIRGIMRMSVYQLFYMEQVPDSAVCNEAVKLAVKRKFGNLRGFVNGVLRSVAREKDNIKYPDKKDGFVKYASVKYSMPEWIVEKIVKEYSEEQAESLFRQFVNDDKFTTARINLSKGTRDFVTEQLEKDGVTVSKGQFFDYAVRMKDYDKLSELKAFKEGFIQIQDESSMVTAAVAAPAKNNIVIVVCAAPGGKTLHAADMLDGTGKVISCDLTENKTKLIRENVERLGFKNIEVYVNDASVFRKEWENTADIIIADLPCSGLGVIGKKCDIKYKTKPEDIKELANIQKNILRTVVRYLKPGGRLVFSTCTIVSEENQENVKWICEELKLKKEDIDERLPKKLRGTTGADGYIQILPDVSGTDGFFVASFVK